MWLVGENRGNIGQKKKKNTWHSRTHYLAARSIPPPLTHEIFQTSIHLKMKH